MTPKCGLNNFAREHTGLRQLFERIGNAGKTSSNFRFQTGVKSPATLTLFHSSKLLDYDYLLFTRELRAPSKTDNLKMIAASFLVEYQFEIKALRGV